MDFYKLYEELTTSFRDSFLGENTDEFTGKAIDNLVLQGIKKRCENESLETACEYDKCPRTDLQLIHQFEYDAMYREFLRENPQLYNKLAHYDVWDTLERDGLEKLKYARDNFHNLESFSGYNLGRILNEGSWDVLGWMQHNWGHVQNIGGAMIAEICRQDNPVECLEYIKETLEYGISAQKMILRSQHFEPSAVEEYYN